MAHETLRDPVRQAVLGLARSGQRHQVKLLALRQIRSRLQCCHLAIPDEQQRFALQRLSDPLNQRHVQWVVGPVPGNDATGHHPAQRVERRQRHFQLPQRRIVFAVPKLHQRPPRAVMMARHCGHVHPHRLLRQVVHPHRAGAQLALDPLPHLRLTQMRQHDAQAIIGEVRLPQLHPCGVFEGALRLFHPLPHRQLAVVTLRDDAGQPDCGHPAPIQPLLFPVARDVAVDDLGHSHLLHHVQQQHYVTHIFDFNLWLLFHAP